MKQRMNVMFGQNHGLALDLEKEKIDRLFFDLAVNSDRFMRVSEEMFINLDRIDFIVVSDIDEEHKEEDEQ